MCSCDHSIRCEAGIARINFCNDVQKRRCHVTCVLGAGLQLRENRIIHCVRRARWDEDVGTEGAELRGDAALGVHPKMQQRGGNGGASHPREQRDETCAGAVNRPPVPGPAPCAFIRPMSMRPWMTEAAEYAPTARAAARSDANVTSHSSVRTRMRILPSPSATRRITRTSEPGKTCLIE